MKNYLKDKIAITGTGRCGTTLLMRTLTAYDRKLTGFKDHEDTVQRAVQAGQEVVVDPDDPASWVLNGRVVWKDPGLTERLPGLVEHGQKPKLIIVPMRSVKEAAVSRLNANRPWFPRHDEDLSNVPHEDWPEWVTEQGQEDELHRGLGMLMETCALNRIPLLTITYRDLEMPHTLWDALSQQPAFLDTSAKNALGLHDFQRMRRAHSAVYGQFV